MNVFIIDWYSWNPWLTPIYVVVTYWLMIYIIREQNLYLKKSIFETKQFLVTN